MNTALALLLVLSLSLPAAARPQVLVVVADHLTLDGATRPDLAGFARLRAGGRTALMSPGLAHGADPVANVYATLGAGDSITVGNVSQGRLASALRRAGVRTALIGDADGDDTGEYRPASLLLPLADETHVGADDGTVPDPVACGGRHMDPEKLWARTRAALGHCDLVLVHDGDFARIERENRRGDLSPFSYVLHRRQALRSLDEYLKHALEFAVAGNGRQTVFALSPVPPLRRDGAWDRLTWCLQAPQSGVDLRVGTSATTQTLGLISTRDFAPTVLAALSVPAPFQMTGAPMVAGTGDKSEADGPRDLRRLDRQTRLNQDAQGPLFWSLGFAAAAVVFAGLILYLSGRMATIPGARRACLFGLRLLSAWPLALLLAPLADSPTLTAYLAAIVLVTALIALLPSPSVIYSLTACVLFADGLMGTRLVSHSVLSAYALSGIRFYGIGNEYMGLLLGGALLWAVGPLSAPEGRRGSLLLFLWFGLVTFVLSYPAFGAKAGGAVTATATFVMAWRGLRGLPVSWKHAAAGVMGGFALVFVWAGVGHWLPSRHTHIDTAVHAVGQGRLGYIAGVALRKVGLAVRVFLLPGTLMGVLGLILIGGFARLFLRRQVGNYLGRHVRFAAAWRAGLWGCGVAVLFNDSGVIAAILLVTCLTVTLLYGLYQECALSPSMSGKSASASPSATS